MIFLETLATKQSHAPALISREAHSPGKKRLALPGQMMRPAMIAQPNRIACGVLTATTMSVCNADVAVVIAAELLGIPLVLHE